MALLRSLNNTELDYWNQDVVWVVKVFVFTHCWILTDLKAQENWLTSSFIFPIQPPSGYLIDTIASCPRCFCACREEEKQSSSPLLALAWLCLHWALGGEACLASLPARGFPSRATIGASATPLGVCWLSHLFILGTLKPECDTQRRKQRFLISQVLELSYVHKGKHTLLPEAAIHCCLSSLDWL